MVFRGTPVRSTLVVCDEGLWRLLSRSHESPVGPGEPTEDGGGHVLDPTEVGTTVARSTVTRAVDRSFLYRFTIK